MKLNFIFNKWFLNMTLRNDSVDFCSKGTFSKYEDQTGRGGLKKIYFYRLKWSTLHKQRGQKFLKRDYIVWEYLLQLRMDHILTEMHCYYLSKESYYSENSSTTRWENVVSFFRIGCFTSRKKIACCLFKNIMHDEVAAATNHLLFSWIKGNVTWWPFS